MRISVTVLRSQTMHILRAKDWISDDEWNPRFVESSFKWAELVLEFATRR